MACTLAEGGQAHQPVEHQPLIVLAEGLGRRQIDQQFGELLPLFTGQGRLLVERVQSQGNAGFVLKSPSLQLTVVILAGLLLI